MSPTSPSPSPAPSVAPHSGTGTAVEIHAPGRVNLIGEHTDYNGGLVLPFAISLGLDIRITFRPLSPAGLRPGTTALTCSSTLEGESYALSAGSLRGAVEACSARPLSSNPVALAGVAHGTSIAYVAGAVALFLARGAFEAKESARSLLEGKAALDVRIDSTLPTGAGLSSSAALSTGVVVGVQALFAGRLTAGELARTAMYVEHRFAGTRCGLMDQLAVAFGREGSFVAIDFAGMAAGGDFVLELVQAHEAFSDYVPVAFHTGVSHSLASSEYNQRRLECEEALALANALTGLGLASLGAYSEPAACARLVGAHEVSQEAAKDALRAAFAAAGVPEARAGLLAKRAAHAILENHRVRAAMKALRDGDTRALGEAMRASHASLRDDYEVSCKELDLATILVPETCERVARERGIEGPAVIGARMTGGGFGGSTIQLVRRELVQPVARLLTATENPYSAVTGAKPRLVVSPPSNGIRLRYA